MPSKIIKIKNKTALIESGSHKHKVDLSLLKNIKVNDYVLVHANLAINKIAKSDAKKILQLINEPNK